MFGRAYLIEHCFMLEKERQKELAHKIYMTDALKNINDAFVKHFGGYQMKQRFYDIVHEMDTVDTKENPQEIIERISNKLDKLGKTNERI